MGFPRRQPIDYGYRRAMADGANMEMKVKTMRAMLLTGHGGDYNAMLAADRK